MKKSCFATCLLFAIILAGHTQGRVLPQSDPDAKGTVTLTSSADDTTIKGSGAVTAAQGWTVGAVTFLAAPEGGGRVRLATGTVNQGAWTASITNAPNGTYTVYAFFVVTNAGQEQRIGTSLDTVVVNVANNPNAEINGGSIAFGNNQPARTNGGAQMSGSGAYTIKPNYESTANEAGVVILMVTIPKDGGVVRTGTPATYGQGSWPNTNVSVPNALSYNVVVTMALRPDPVSPPNPADVAHNINSAWAKNK